MILFQPPEIRFLLTKHHYPCKKTQIQIDMDVVQAGVLPEGGAEFKFYHFHTILARSIVCFCI